MNDKMDDLCMLLVALSIAVVSLAFAFALIYWGCTGQLNESHPSTVNQQQIEQSK